ncbi:unnamed protein product [Prunus armeniaca]
MPFSLKNAGDTYERAMTAVFNDMMGKEVEDYVDDLVVKPKTIESHQEVLRKVLERCRLYRLKVNPKKCSFGVSSGKFLGFCGIDMDPEKTRAINSLAPPRNPKELKSFMGRLSYIRRFIPSLAATMSVFTPLLKKGKPYEWSKECQEAYQQVQQLITKLPTMRALIRGLPLKLYLATTNATVGALLTQDDHDGEESPIYYVSRQLRGAETRYPNTELLCLALVYAAQRLRHYFLAHKLQLIVKSDLVRYLLTRPVLSGCFACWLLQQSEFHITCTTPKAIKGQAVIDMLKYVDALATLGSKLSFVEEQPSITVIKKDMPVVEAMTQEEPLEKATRGNLHLPRGILTHCIGTTEERVKLQEDWKAPYLAFFIDGTLPTNSKHARKLKKIVKRYFIDGSTLYRKGFNGKPLKCLGESEAQQVMREIHARDCGEHQGMKRLHRQLLNVQYYWPTMKNNAYNFVKKTIHPLSDGYIWILTATEYFTKWVEAVPLWKATGVAISNFIREYIVCRFRIPYKIVIEKGTPFVNKQVSSTLSSYGVKHRHSMPYYSEGNGQAEASNKTLLRILSKMVHEYEGGWSVHLPDALWAYRTSPRSARVSAVNDLEWDTTSCSDWLLLDLEALDKKRAVVERRIAVYHITIPQTYNKTVNRHAFKQGDLVLKVVEHVRRRVSGPSKSAPQWEDTFAVKEVDVSDYYCLVSVKEGALMDPINGKWLKPYYC